RVSTEYSCSLSSRCFLTKRKIGENKERNDHVRKFTGEGSSERLGLDTLDGSTSVDFSAGVDLNRRPRRRSEGRSQQLHGVVRGLSWRDGQRRRTQGRETIGESGRPDRLREDGQSQRRRPPQGHQRGWPGGQPQQ